MRQPTKKGAAVIITILAATAIAAALLLPKIPHPPSYHDFADDRSFMGMPNALDVLSNIPLVVLGAFGIGICLKNRSRNPKTESFGLKILFFATVLLTGFGSSIYHWQPGNDSIVWDRIPLSVTFMILFLVVLADRISPKIAGKLLWPTLMAGPISVFYWRWSELEGAGDLRFYGIVQLLPMLLIPAAMILQPKGSIKNRDIWKSFAWYACAKLFEFQDRPIFEWTGCLSGHTLKHICAGIAVCYLLHICTVQKIHESEAV
jgi:hypothetical protein